MAPAETWQSISKQVPELEIDTNSTVRYVLRVEEGEVYSMGDLDIRGLDARMTARLEDDWRLRGGDPYDSSYPKQFWTGRTRDLGTVRLGCQRARIAQS